MIRSEKRAQDNTRTVGILVPFFRSSSGPVHNRVLTDGVRQDAQGTLDRVDEEGQIQNRDDAGRRSTSLNAQELNRGQTSVNKSDVASSEVSKPLPSFTLSRSVTLVRLTYVCVTLHHTIEELSDL